MAFSGKMSEPRNDSQQPLQDKDQFTYSQPFGAGARMYSEPNAATHMLSGELGLGMAAAMATLPPQSQPDQRALQHQQPPNRHPSLQHLQHHSQDSFQHPQHPSPTPVGFTNPFTPIPSNFTLGPPFQPQVHDISPHQPAVQAMFTYPNSTAWRQFADTIMHNIGPEQAYLQNMPALDQPGRAGDGPAGTTDLDPNAYIAGMSGMHLPLQNGGAEQRWPLIHNVNNPH
jgi:hypothetical protein